MHIVARPHGDDARRRDRAGLALLGAQLDWTVLRGLPAGDATTPPSSKSALASRFVAALELARQGRLELAQDEAVRAADGAGAA